MYRPKSPKVQRAIDAMQADPEREFTSRELSQIMDVPVATVPKFLESARVAGLVYRGGAKVSDHYRRVVYSAAPPARQEIDLSSMRGNPFAHLLARAG